jgi:CubicO group peptidase (beta-lactamase class C family)
LGSVTIARVADYWRDVTARGQIVGGVLLVAQEGKLRYAGALGWADRKAGQRITRQTRFRLASLSKLLTSVCVLRLCELELLQLDAAVGRWLPRFRPRLADGREPVICLRHLLSHTAGLGYGFEMPPGNPYERAGVSDGLDQVAFGMDENLRRLADAPLLFEPGSAWRYSLATDVLGAVIEAAGGLPLPDAIARWVTGPLGMTATSFARETGQILPRAYKDGGLPMAVDEVLEIDGCQARLTPDRQGYPSAGAGLLGTADEYLRVLECLRLGGAPLLQPASTALLLGNAIGDNEISHRGPGWKFGLGPLLLTDPVVAGQRQGAGTWSWCGLYGCHYWVDPEARISLVCLTNTAVAGAWGEVADGLVAAIYG